MKKKVYIISHSHLDREWYMPYEQHHMRVVELFDELIDSFENDSRFRYFHLDGQTLPLDDYFEVKPQNRPMIERYIREGRLRIGPFYILQDDFLISSEANARNTLIGMQESKKYGEPVRLGYFPDTFGNMGQTPQMMQKLGITAAAFGRGVKPTGFNNMVTESYSSQFSEMMWQGPDGSEIFGLLFANWYSNGNEIPSEKEAAIEFWQRKLSEVEKYASTNHLLMMNGCDHQPLQKDVGQAIELANELFPDYEFIHSHFDEYLTAVQADLPKSISTVKGELTSQETPGWYTLANTASARVYLKQKNVETQTWLENLAEPLSVFAYDITGLYKSDELRYAWKYLLQNHPHDSICGCSVDEVHQEMMTRYQKSIEVAKYVSDEALTTIANAVDTTIFDENSLPFLVFNTASTKRTQTISVKIEIDRIPFSEKFPNFGYEELEKRATPAFSVINASGESVPVIIKDVVVEFGYDLPKDGFRVPYMAKYIIADIYAKDLPMMSYQTFAFVAQKSEENVDDTMILDNRTLENDFLKVDVTANGSLTIFHKRSETLYENQLVFEDVGDIGNEYIFKQSSDNQSILSTGFPYETKIIENTAYQAIIELTNFMELPIAADESFEWEQKKVIDITNRQAKRSIETAPFTIKTLITMEKDNPFLKFATSFDNQHKDHRVRVLFNTKLISKTHHAESIFEAVERPNTVSEQWVNPSNPQHTHAFVNVKNAEQVGVTIGNVGLNEYEVLPESNTIAMTLLRSVGEMGDWGYFPTPEAQCLGKNTVEYSFYPHTAKDYYESLQQAIALKIPISVKQTSIHSGTQPSVKQLLTNTNTQFVFTALKLSEEKVGIVTRGYSLNNHKGYEFTPHFLGKQAKEVNMLEEEEKEFTQRVTPAEILSLIWRES